MVNGQGMPVQQLSAIQNLIIIAFFQIDGASRYFGVWVWQLVHLLILVCSFPWCVLFLCLANLSLIVGAVLSVIKAYSFGRCVSSMQPKLRDHPNWHISSNESGNAYSNSILLSLTYSPSWIALRMTRAMESWSTIIVLWWWNTAWWTRRWKSVQNINMKNSGKRCQPVNNATSN